MAVTSTWYGQFFMSMANKELDFDSDAFKVMLVTSSYTFDRDNHRYKSSVTNEVANGNGYTTGGVALASAALSYDATNHRTKFTAANVSWTASTFTARGAIVYDSTPASDATRPLMLYINFGQDFSPVSGQISITWDALGLGYINA